MGLVEKLRKLADSTEPSPGVVGACMCEAADEIERLRDDAKEHDQLWAASEECSRKMFAELRKDLDLPPSRLTK